MLRYIKILNWTNIKKYKGDAVEGIKEKRIRFYHFSFKYAR